jgi:hypothetical protein
MDYPEIPMPEDWEDVADRVEAEHGYAARRLYIELQKLDGIFKEIDIMFEEFIMEEDHK